MLRRCSKAVKAAPRPRVAVPPEIPTDSRRRRVLLWLWDALSEGDLRLEAAPSQTSVSNIHYAATYTDQNGGACASGPKRRSRDWAAVAALAFAAIAWGRRRMRA